MIVISRPEYDAWAADEIRAVYAAIGRTAEEAERVIQDQYPRTQAEAMRELRFRGLAPEPWQGEWLADVWDRSPRGWDRLFSARAIDKWADALVSRDKLNLDARHAIELRMTMLQYRTLQGQETAEHMRRCEARDDARYGRQADG